MTGDAMAELRRWLVRGEGNDAQRMLALLESAGEACFQRDHFEPGHFTASAFVLSPDGGSLLLIHHAKLGRWLQPGGHIDASDASPLAAARRELLEETGVVAEPASVGPIDLDVHPIPTNPRKGEPAHEHFDVRFLFRASSAELKAGDDALDARWWPLSEVAETAEDASVRRVAGRLLTRTAGERRA